MVQKKISYFIVTILLLFGYSLFCQTVNSSLDYTTKKEIIDSVSKIVRENYVFQDLGAKMSDFIQKQFKENKYDQISSIKEFPNVLTADLWSVCKDEHFRVNFEPNLPLPDTTSEEEKARTLKKQIETEREQNFYFKEVKILGDDIGYLRFDKFTNPKYSHATAVAAMNYLANCKALIIDLRYNGGGYSEMVTLLLSYFFDEPVHYRDNHNRRINETEQAWTTAYVSGPKMTDVDLYVLTSNGYTFSAAEDFAYALKCLNRGTIVGETTSGGAHSVDFFYLRKYSIELKIPTGRAYDPKTGLDWEGVGVEPDVKTSANDAFEVSYKLALQNFIKKEEKYHREKNEFPAVTLENLGIDFALVKGGTFQMGDTFGEGRRDELPMHTVTLDSFYISKTEVTFNQYDKFCEATGRAKPDDKGWGRGNRPVINVSWYDARDFCLWLSWKTNQEISLPTEAEWEYAAREGGKDVRFGNGKLVADPNEINFNCDKKHKHSYSITGSNREHTLPVASFKPNSLGIYDMAGNVFEWCSDWYDKGYYSYSPSLNPKGPDAETFYRVLKGGAWDSSPASMRCSRRIITTPGDKYSDLGFRVVRKP